MRINGPLMPSTQWQETSYNKMNNRMRNYPKKKEHSVSEIEENVSLMFWKHEDSKSKQEKTRKGGNLNVIEENYTENRFTCSLPIIG